MKNKFFVLIFIILTAINNHAFATDNASNPIVSTSDKALALSSDSELEILRLWQSNNGLNKNLSFGDNNDDVKIIQNALFNLGFINDQDDITGFFGPKTLAATKIFQKENIIPTTGFVGEKTRNIINGLYFNALCPMSSGQYPDQTFLSVGKFIGLPQNYIPQDLVSLGDYNIKTFGIICLKRNAATNLENMFKDAKNQKINLAVTSGFRSYQIQNFLYNYWLKSEGSKALNEIAPPGNSEHQLGTAVDLTGASVNFQAVDKNFINSPESQWLENNAYKYGFIMSYEGKNADNEYISEPWHYRFVGDVLASRIHDRNLPLENYLQIFNKSADKIISNTIGNMDLENFINHWL